MKRTGYLGHVDHAKNHFTLQKVNTDDLYNTLMLCEVNVEVTSLCVK